MRAYIIGGGAVLVSSALSFLAGAWSQRSPEQGECPSLQATHEETAPVEPEAAAPGAAAAAELPAPSSDADEGVWPYKKWVIEDEMSGERIYSKVRFLWIHPEPRTTKTFLGYLSLGDSVRLKGTRETAVAGKSHSNNCQIWYAVEPRGYVCVADDTASFDPNDPTIAMLRATKANRMSPFPFRYGESTGTPVYDGIPPKHAQRKMEAMVEDHLGKVRAARLAKTEAERVAIDERFAGVDVQLTNKEPPSLLPLPPLGKTARVDIVRGSTVGYIDSFDADGRAWLLSWDRGLVPRDRVKLYPESRFHGVAIDENVKLPVAFFRAEQPRMRRDESGNVVPAEGKWERYSWVMATEEQIDHGGKRYVVTKPDGLLADVETISVARRSHYLPPQVTAGDGKSRRTWIDVSILGGWLVAYEHDKPVYATMVAPGRGGVPKDGVDPLETASTPVGKFRITAKFVTATMISNASKHLIHDEVMYTQNFSGPYALHGAYWHDEWGKGKSGGCVNLAPIDARRLFAWTEPQLPPSWHAVQLVTGYEGALAEYENATLVYLHK